MTDAMVQWCVSQLQRDFGLEVCEDVVRYILSIDNAEEIEEYVGGVLQGTDGRKRQFIDEFLSRWSMSKGQTTETSSLLFVKESSPASDSSEMSKDLQRKSKRKGRNKQEAVVWSQAEPEAEPVKTPIDLRKDSTNTSSTKKKTKFVSLYAKEGQDKLAILLPGRQACECLAQKHKLINNCISCGRIVCEQEGSGPCIFCGSLVCTKEEQEILQRGSNKSQKLRKKLLGEAGEREYLPCQEARMKSGLEKAIEHKDKLLEYDRTSVKRTQVLDDESDYFASESNQWLTPSERDKMRKKEEELRELRHVSHRDRKITLDFAGRQVVEEGDNLSSYYSKLDETLKAMNSDGSQKLPRNSVGQTVSQNLRDLVNPNIVQSAPVWVDVGGSQRHRTSVEQGKRLEESVGEERSRLRLQDRELQEMSDAGWCLSMHQPWASLLVKGIKRVEGRTWYSSHRGRLWIAAAAKRPTPQEIAEVESMYRYIHKKEPKFPKDYPTACLLGCVNMTDCLSQEQFREQAKAALTELAKQYFNFVRSRKTTFAFPDTCEESASPFVFICTNPQELVVKFPMKGKHKLWKLESHYHQGAKKGLVPSAAD